MGARAAAWLPERPLCAPAFLAVHTHGSWGCTPGLQSALRSWHHGSGTVRASGRPATRAATVRSRLFSNSHMAAAHASPTFSLRRAPGVTGAALGARAAAPLPERPPAFSCAAFLALLEAAPGA